MSRKQRALYFISRRMADSQRAPVHQWKGNCEGLEKEYSVQREISEKLDRPWTNQGSPTNLWLSGMPNFITCGMKIYFYLYNKPLIVICFIFSRTCVTSWRSYSTDAKAFFGHSHSWWVNLHASSTIFFLFHLRGFNLLWGIISEAVGGFISTPAPISIISVQRDSLTYKNRLLSVSGSTHYDNNGHSLEEMAPENSMTICKQWH